MLWKSLIPACLVTALAAPGLAQPPNVPKQYFPSEQDRPPGVMPDPVYPKKERGRYDLSNGVPMIPRAILFGNPEKAQARISPDGKHIAYLAPVDGVLNVWVGPREDLTKAKPVTNDAKRGIRSYSWAYSSNHVLYPQDKGGDENWRIYSVDIASGETKDLTPMDKVAARIVATSERFPDEIIVGLNDRDPRYHDLYRLNVRTGDKSLLAKNDAGYAGFVVDDDFRVRFAERPNKDGSVTVLKADGKGGYGEYDTIPHEDTDTTAFLGFDKSGSKVFLADARGRDTAALYEMDVETKAKTVIREDPLTDISTIMVNPTTKKLEAVRTTYHRDQWNIVDPAITLDFYTLATGAGTGDKNVTSRSQDDRYWIVAINEDDAPAKTCLLDRGDLKDPKRKPKLTTLFVSRQDLVSQPLVPVHFATIKARDGMPMNCYFSIPLEADPDRDGKPEKAMPTVLVVHGGPWARDTWGYNPLNQWLANRGYAVINVNFRGSTGFGKKHLNAANMEWAGKMHDDLIDAVKWAVDKKIADPKKVAIMGGSYGGYATLVGLTFTPDTFACGVDIVGPSNLRTLLGSIPPYWEPEIDQMTKRVGDHRTPDGQKFLDSRSPLTFVDKIQRPLLIGQGANDPRVKQAEADQIVRAMQDKRIPVTYVLYPDEGHGFARPPNRISFYAVAEAFLSQNLGGRAEPIGDAFKGSTITVPEGADVVPGLSEALAGSPKPPAKSEEPKH